MQNDENTQKKDYDKLCINKCKSDKSISKSRVILSQCLAVVAIGSAKYSYGSFMGLTIILVPLLHEKNAEIIVTLHELTWFGSSYFMPSIGAILGGLLAHRLGTRLLMMTCAILFLTAGLIFHWTNDVASLSCAQAIASLSGGLTLAPGHTYIAEITQPHLRSTLMAFLNLSIHCGLFITVMMGGYVYWRLIALINLTFPLILCVVALWIPESPYWLACKDRFHEAQFSLAWFRGWTTVQSVKAEFSSMTNDLKNLSVSDRLLPINEDITNFGKTNRWKTILKPYLSYSFYAPFMTICFIIFINDFGGTNVIKTYSMLVFKEIHSPVSAHTATTILSASRIVGAISVIFTIRYLGKRKLIFFSVLGAGVSFLTAAIFNFLIDKNQLTSDVYFWIPTVAMILATLATSAGIEKIVFLLNSEIYPTRLRQVGAGVGHLASGLIEGVFKKAFLYMYNTFTMSGIFLIFLIVDVIGFIAVYYILPETEGKTLNEIQEYYARKRCLKNKIEYDSKDTKADKITMSNLLHVQEKQ